MATFAQKGLKMHKSCPSVPCTFTVKLVNNIVAQQAHMEPQLVLQVQVSVFNASQEEYVFLRLNKSIARKEFIAQVEFPVMRYYSNAHLD
jgi:hypothetical protein